ncbi:hypothetical protein Hdeb2414_s0020g00560991 [Helianthus debilis subsp. tardiflorus]
MQDLINKINKYIVAPLPTMYLVHFEGLLKACFGKIHKQDQVLQICSNSHIFNHTYVISM